MHMPDLATVRGDRLRPRRDRRTRASGSSLTSARRPAQPGQHARSGQAGPARRARRLRRFRPGRAHPCQALLAGHDSGIAVIGEDIRDTGRIFGNPHMRRLIDFSQPVAVLFVAVLHGIPDADGPAGIVTEWVRQVFEQGPRTRPVMRRGPSGGSPHYAPGVDREPGDTRAAHPVPSPSVTEAVRGWCNQQRRGSPEQPSTARPMIIPWSAQARPRHLPGGWTSYQTCVSFARPGIPY